MNHPKQIAYITDLHLGEDFPSAPGYHPEKNWQRILSDLAEKKISDIFIGGDIGSASVYERFFRQLSSFNLHLTPGNHDQPEEILKYYKNPFLQEGHEIHYAFAEGPFHYLFLDSSRDELGARQLAWLQGEVSAQKNILLFLHHPVLAVETAADRLYPLRDREKVLSILQGSSSSFHLFCGHYHLQDETAMNHIHQVVTPAASYQIRRNVNEIEIDTGSFGYRIITLKDLEVESRIIMFRP